MIVLLSFECLEGGTWLKLHHWQIWTKALNPEAANIWKLPMIDMGPN